MYKYTIATVTVHICTDILACAYNILIIFSLTSQTESYLPLSQAHSTTLSFSHLINLSSSSFHWSPSPPRRQWEQRRASQVVGRVHHLQHEQSSPLGPSPRILWVLIHFGWVWGCRDSDCGCGSVVSMIVGVGQWYQWLWSGLFGCSLGVFWFFILGLFLFFFFLLAFFGILVWSACVDSDVNLVAWREAGGVDLERDGGCVSCVGLKKWIFYLNKCV